MELRKASTSNRDFINLVPFARNIIEYTKGKSSEEYMKLTDCLHLKDQTEVLLDKDISEIVRELQGTNYHKIDEGKKFVNVLKKEAEAIFSKKNADEVYIENKVVLSIAIRLKAEEFMKHKLLTHEEIEEQTLNVTHNQTSEWIKLMKQFFPDYSMMSVLECVNMMTPENIHLNSFMYESLINMSLHHLRKLYTDCNGLQL